MLQSCDLDLFSDGECTVFFCLQEDDDVAYEEDILRNPYAVKCWLRYIEYKKDAPKQVINTIYERALKQLPGRYYSQLILDIILYCTK